MDRGDLEVALRVRFTRRLVGVMLDYCDRYQIDPADIVGISYGKIGAQIVMTDGKVHYLHEPKVKL